MKLGKRTAKLVREAAIAGFVAGNRYGPDPTEPPDGFPNDTQIWIYTLRVARKCEDVYPSLARVAWESDELKAHDERVTAETLEYMKAVVAEREGAP